MPAKASMAPKCLEMLLSSSSAIGAIIAGTGSCLPEKRLTNDALSRMVDTNDEWIVQRTGIKERRIAGEGESTATLATQAARRALAAAEIEPKDLDLIVCGTITPEMHFPSTACFVAAALGLNSTPAFDVSAACSGFLYALETGANYIKAGRYKRGHTARSALLDGFSVDVSAVFDAN